MNNCLERWHRAVNSTLTAPHPNVYKLIHILQKQQQEGEQNLRLLNAGHAPPPQRQRYLRVTDRLLNLRQRLDDGDITAYHFAGAAGAVLKLA